jgi:hypothetical protein
MRYLGVLQGILASEIKNSECLSRLLRQVIQEKVFKVSLYAGQSMEKWITAVFNFLKFLLTELCNIDIDGSNSKASGSKLAEFPREGINHGPPQPSPSSLHVDFNNTIISPYHFRTNSTHTVNPPNISTPMKPRSPPPLRLKVGCKR